MPWKGGLLGNEMLITEQMTESIVLVLWLDYRKAMGMASAI